MRHVCNISGGKDSAALAIFLKEKGIGGGGGGEVEYVFADTGAELPETYEFVDRLEKFLETPIVRLKAKRKTSRANWHILVDGFHRSVTGGVLQH